MLEILHARTSVITSLKKDDRYQSIIVMPSIDMDLAKKAAEVMRLRTNQPGLLILIEDDMRLGFIMTANLVYARTASRYFAYVAQDAFPGQYWLEYGMETLEKTQSGLLSFNDGRFFGKIAVFGLADRQWLDSVYRKFIFYPEYHSHFADTELSMIAAETGNLVFNPNCIMMEVDYDKHLHPNNSADEALYRKRAETGFDGRIRPFTPV